jgi:dethiobiotin synthetase
VAALKPIVSGGREDAECLATALGGALSIEEINPWYFRSPLSPWLAARREGRRVTLTEVVAHVRAIRLRFGVVLVEGAGGLLSPMGERFDARDLIVALRALPLIVAPNRLGVVNQVLLVLEALPGPVARRAQIVLVEQSRPDDSAASNLKLLRQWLDVRVIHDLPWLDTAFRLDRAVRQRNVRRTLSGLVDALPS